MSMRAGGLSARCLMVLAAPLLVLGVMAGTAQASAVFPVSHGRVRVAGGPAAARVSVPASLRAAIGKSLGDSAVPAGYS